MSLEHVDKSNYYSQDIFYLKGPVEYASEVWSLSGGDAVYTALKKRN
jgi:hypothetical protein